MKATGIVRRIDDLGMVVIPKEIRRTMRIRDGDPLEIYTEKDGEVIFKKYSPMGELSDFAVQMCDTLSKTTGVPAAITDRDSVIAVCGVSKRELSGKQISGELEGVMGPPGLSQGCRREGNNDIRQRRKVSCDSCRPDYIGGRRHGLCTLFHRGRRNRRRGGI